MPTVAAIDVGTNTVRLLVADAEGPGAYRVRHQEQAITRLGEGLEGTGRLAPAAIERTVAAVARYAAAARHLGAVAVRAVATSAAREAANREAFLAAAAAAGCAVTVVDPEEEARLTTLGALHLLPRRGGRCLVIDIGGGSTEFTLTAGSAPRQSVSLPLGVVKLTERLFREDPPPAEARAACAAHVREAGAVRKAVAAGVPFQPPLRSVEAIGTGGTATTLAALELGLDPYDGDRVTGYRLGVGRIRGLLHRLAATPLGARQRLPGLEPGRADVIVAGTSLLAEALDVLGFDGCTVTDGGLREGILLDTLARRLAPAGPRPGG
ncbi:MAG: Ppx/GppA family phosphatase [candidate division NC10 bacterium]|nr:Ppx/GppA family phosphatase [candidate division NC10 bacterium]